MRVAARKGARGEEGEGPDALPAGGRARARRAGGGRARAAGAFGLRAPGVIRLCLRLHPSGDRGRPRPCPTPRRLCCLPSAGAPAAPRAPGLRAEGAVRGRSSLRAVLPSSAAFPSRASSGADALARGRGGQGWRARAARREAGPAPSGTPRLSAAPPGSPCPARVPGRPPIRLRPQIRRGDPLNLSILVSGGKETNQDSLSNGE